MSPAWYNDNEVFVAEWLRNLIAAGHLPGGIVDDRSIEEVKAEDLQGYDQAHFFAGIGGWPLALGLAGWPADVPVWTGSCPCQPFSVAGRRAGTADERHLWPEWFRLIKECRPPTIFGEQVASKDGYAWFDIVQADLESLDYACGMVVSPAAGYGAPHIRHRIYFVAESSQQQRNRSRSTRSSRWDEYTDSGSIGTVADCSNVQPFDEIQTGGPHDSRTFWADAEWLLCTDGKARPTQPGLFPLAYGIPARVGRLRAYGNAVVVPQAIEFVRAYMDVRKDQGNDIS